ncbi:MAG: HAD family hydrolase [Gammaproteobacteria bacterium]|nr:MAG: HAD family hydrolase [Gammaproteobacteria bacterium]
MNNFVAPPQNKTTSNAYTKSADEVIQALKTSRHGLSHNEVSNRLKQYGRNALPQPKPPGIVIVFLSQFASPLIYVLVAAALLSIAIKEFSDAGFITAVLMINAIIGTIQEFSAQRAATALQQLVTTHTRVLRDSDTHKIDAEELVPGDIVMLESGDRIPADLRLLNTHDLEIDESLLTGESLSVSKSAEEILDEETFLGDRRNMAFAGSLVDRGRGQGVVVATGFASELGHIASEVLTKKPAKAPLLIRMEKFTHWVAILVGIAAFIMAVVSLNRGMPFEEIFLLAVALAVSAMPEGLPVALTVALAISMRRMAHRNIIIRRLVAVESLGSCTFIATDKTGTLTVNQMTARRIGFPDNEVWKVTGKGHEPSGTIHTPRGTPRADERTVLERLCVASVLTNDAFLDHRDHGWVHHGDTVDVALLVMAHKAGIDQQETSNTFPEIANIPFESERLFSASLNRVNDEQHAFVKGALEKLLPMCNSMATPGQDIPLDPSIPEKQAHKLATNGYRILAIAAGKIELKSGEVFSEDHLQGLTLLGIVGMIDPLRKEVKAAVAACRDAGVEVAMVTGDHPSTALAIARKLDLADHQDHIVTGPQLKQTTDEKEYDSLTSQARVFARVEPRQKLDIVQSLQRNGHYVAVSGDGANDAPALRAAQIGVAMGKSGTDVARETAGLIITDDNFSSIVAGVEEGRVAYSNVRKVIFLLISTGVSELVLFTLALIAGQPLPLLAVQLLWLNLVTNGIQDVALALEPGEGNELKRPPRAPKEPIFNRIMIERVVISALVIGIVAFYLFNSFLASGFSVDEARNATLLLMVLFENVHVFNCRSETRSALFHNPLRNKILLFGTLIAQMVHIGAMYTPWIKDVLKIQPVTLDQWLELLFLALTVLVAMELHKLLRQRFLPANNLANQKYK